MTIPPAVAKAAIDLIGLIGEHAVVALLENAAKRKRETELRANKSLFQRLFSRRGAK